MGVDRTFDYVPSLEAEVVALRAKVAAADLQHIRLRDGARRAANRIEWLAEQLHHGTGLCDEKDPLVAELRKLVQP